MAPPESRSIGDQTQAAERGAALALLPLAATLDFYALPDWLQDQTLIQFAPQIIAYLACALWAAHNSSLIARFGLEREKFAVGLRWGLLIGLILGCINSFVILWLVPSLGHDITFLKDTPHGLLPPLIMVPWFICAIAWFVEFNFRGFLLGRLIAIGEAALGPSQRLPALAGAITISALAFAFDPFMVTIFKHLHWIAVWDGVIWASIWVRTKNLYMTIAAHAIEVIIMYSAVRASLMT